MESILNILGDFPNAVTAYWVQIIFAVTFITILAIVLFVGWKFNRKEPYRAEEFLRSIAVRYRKGEIPRKEYEDIKREIKDPLDQLNYYLKVYR